MIAKAIDLTYNGMFSVFQSFLLFGVGPALTLNIILCTNVLVAMGVEELNIKSRSIREFTHFIICLSFGVYTVVHVMFRTLVAESWSFSYIAFSGASMTLIASLVVLYVAICLVLDWWIGRNYHRNNAAL